MPKTNISNPGASGGEKECGGEGTTGNRTIINNYVGIIGAAAAETKAVPHLETPSQRAKPGDTDAKLNNKGLVLKNLKESEMETKEQLKRKVEELLGSITKTTILIDDVWRLGKPIPGYVRKVRIQFKTVKDRKRSWENQQNAHPLVLQKILSAEEIKKKKSLQEEKPKC